MTKSPRLLIIVFAILFSSCKKDVLLKKDGEWNFVYKVIYNSGSGVGSPFSTSYGKITFEKDNRGRMQVGNSIATFKWERASDSILITTDGGTVANGGTKIYKIIKDKKNFQMMISHFVSIYETGDVSLELYR